MPFLWTQQSSLLPTSQNISAQTALALGDSVARVASLLETLSPRQCVHSGFCHPGALGTAAGHVMCPLTVVTWAQPLSHPPDHSTMPPATSNTSVLTHTTLNSPKQAQPKRLQAEAASPHQPCPGGGHAKLGSSSTTLTHIPPSSRPAPSAERRQTWLGLAGPGWWPTGTRAWLRAPPSHRGYCRAATRPRALLTFTEANSA